MKNLKNKKKLLIAFLIISCITAIFAKIVVGATSQTIYQLGLPRGGNQGTDWGSSAKNLMNGWKMVEETVYTVRSIDSYNSKTVYCIEPGVRLTEGVALEKKGEDYWANYPKLNNSISADEVKLFIGRILQYGYTGNNNMNWDRNNDTHQNQMANLIATQALIWEVVVGERDENFNHVDTGSYDTVISTVKSSHPLRSKIMSYYNSIVDSVKNHIKVPSFCARSTSKAKTVALKYDGTNYSTTLTDTNNVLNNYSFSSSEEGISFSTNGNKLTITSSNVPSGSVKITANKKNGKRKGLITWTDGIKSKNNNGQQQDVVSWTEEVNDPVRAFVNVKVSTGNLKIVKKSDDNNVAGIKFTVVGKGTNETVTTKADGSIELSNLEVGTYTVTEEMLDNYEPQESQTVEVIGGQTATVTFNNVLKKGNLKVIKTSEDNIVKNMKFHLYGIAVNGSEVNQYANTNENGIAMFENIPIASNQGYTLEEIDTAVRYVVPDSLNITIKWNETVSATVANKLKKFNVTLTKTDIETGEHQGDGKLSGAVYGIYKDGELVDSYTTDTNGQFTTSYYVCGTNWTVKEITPSEGYLLDNTVYRVGAEPEKYTVEYNSILLDSKEQVKKGKVSIIKHTNNGETQIETPENGAEFEVYLKSAGSYQNAKATERDILICNEDGFAETKMLPYGVYTFHQTKGWEGTEFMKDFDVFVSENGKTYKLLINNAPFEGYIKIVKKDSETNKTIPMAGTAFKLYDENKNLIKMAYTYPQYTEVETFYTNADGFLITPEKLRYGNYFLKEVQAPYGYVIDNEYIPFSVARENSTVENDITVIEIEKTNIAQKGTIQVTKTGEVFSSVTKSDNVYQPIYEVQELEGAVYEIIADENIYTMDGTLRAKKGEIVDTITTKKDEISKSKLLYLGKYIVKEIKAPQGMVISDEIHNVELNYAGQNIEVTETATSFYNERQKVEIELNKILENDKKYGIGNNGEILDVKFGLYASEEIIAQDGTSIPENGLIEVVQIKENGKAICNSDLPIGKYYLKEVVTNKSYILNEEKYEANFEYEGQEIKVAKISVNNGKEIENTLIRGKVQGRKITEDGEGLADVTIGIFNTETTKFTIENAVETTKTLEDGNFEFINVPYGNWIIKEIETVTGFVLSDEEIPVSINDNNEVIEIEMINYYIRGNIALTKVDKDYPDNKLSEAIFEVYEDTNKNEILDDSDILLGQLEEVTKGNYEMKDIKYGLVFVKEVKAPYGFKLDENVYSVFISENGKTYNVENNAGIGFINEAITGKIKIKKTSKDGQLEGFTFVVSGTTFDGKNYEKRFTTNNKGEIVIDNLRIGDYVVYEESNEKSERYILPNPKTVNIKDESEIELEFYNDLPETPQTGDTRNTILWITVLTLATTLLTIVIVYEILKNKKSK